MRNHCILYFFVVFCVLYFIFPNKTINANEGSAAKLGEMGFSFHVVDEEATRIFNITNETIPGVVYMGAFDMGIESRNMLGNPDFVAICVERSLDGSHVLNVRIDEDPYNSSQSIITFFLDVEGGEIFMRLTLANVGRPMAIVFENKVRMVAEIISPIRESVSIQGFSTEEATTIARILGYNHNQ